MVSQPNNLLILAASAFQGGNYAKALAFCESALSLSPTEFLGWIIKARCEAHLQVGDMAGWGECRASLLQAAGLAATEEQKRQAMGAWLECFECILAGLEKQASTALADGVENSHIARLAGIGAVLAGTEAFGAKSTMGRMAGTAGLVIGSVASAHYSNAAKTARLRALQAELTRSALSSDTLDHIESGRATLAGGFGPAARQAAGHLTRALLAAATAAHVLDDVNLLKSLNIGCLVRTGARYLPVETRLAAAAWVKVLAHHQLTEQAVNLAGEYASAVGRPVDPQMLTAEINRRTAALMQSLVRYTAIPLLLLLAYWALVAPAGQPGLLVGLSFAVDFVGGLFCAINIDRILADAYPRFDGSRRSGIVLMTIGLTFGMYTGWYPWWRRRSWATQAAINGTLVEVLDAPKMAPQPTYRGATAAVPPRTKTIPTTF